MTDHPDDAAQTITGAEIRTATLGGIALNTDGITTERLAAVDMTPFTRALVFPDGNGSRAVTFKVGPDGRVTADYDRDRVDEAAAAVLDGVRRLAEEGIL